MSDLHLLSEKLNNREIQLLDLLRQYPLRIDQGIWILSEPPKNLVENATNNVYTINLKALSTLEEKGLTEKQNNEIHLNHLGQKVAEYLQKVASHPQEKHNKQSTRQELSNAKLVKSNEMLELYRQGLSYREIGNQYKITRERVRQILDFNPAFHEYLIEREQAQKQAKAQAQKEQSEKKRQQQLAKSIIALYPERVAELWDYEKNAALSPEEVGAGSTLLSPWFKCPIDGHSWQKRPNYLTTSWSRGASGCPKCAGRKKKPESIVQNTD
ncbi:MAG TPA: hypothetical protein DCS91_22715 [Microcoleaceae bacterium UBA11344]|nr:hypothetical protein [Microcoleaceae cyanobacterium UBA11344]